MNTWKCFTCKVNMDEVEDIQIFYKDLSLPEAIGYRCPECGVEFLEGDFVAQQLSAAEQMLDGK